jgi:hypothetical protein
VKIKWNQIGGQLGLGLALLGGVFLFLGWNGAASYDRVPAQFPYLISGGLVGLSLVVLGSAYILVDNQRRDRAQLQNTIGELRDAVDKLALAQLGTTSNGGGTGSVSTVPGGVVVGPSAYHSPECPLLEGRGPLPTVPVAEAEARGLTPCRVCGGAVDGDDAYVDATPSSGSGSRTRRRSRRS